MNLNEVYVVELGDTLSQVAIDFNSSQSEIKRVNKMESDLLYYGEEILEEGKVLMEIKTTGGIPLWMTHLLTKEHIYKTSFSKYGTAYQKYILPKWKGEC